MEAQIDNKFADNSIEPLESIKYKVYPEGLPSEESYRDPEETCRRKQAAPESLLQRPSTGYRDLQNGAHILLKWLAEASASQFKGSVLITGAILKVSAASRRYLHNGEEAWIMGGM